MRISSAHVPEGLWAERLWADGGLTSVVTFVHSGEGTAVVVAVVNVDADFRRVEQAVVEVESIILGRIAYKTAPLIAIRAHRHGVCR